jgi:hypothetical protein
MPALLRNPFEAVFKDDQLTHEIQVTYACGKWIARIVTAPDRVWTEEGSRHPLILTAPTREEVERSAFCELKRRCESDGQRLLHLNHSACVGLDFSPARRFTRMFPVRFHVLNQQGKGNPKFAENTFTANLSETGLFLVMARRVKKGTILSLMVKLPGHTERLQGEVVWLRYGPETGRPPGAGVRLVDAPLSYRSRLLSLGIREEALAAPT